MHLSSTALAAIVVVHLGACERLPTTTFDAAPPACATPDCYGATLVVGGEHAVRLEVDDDAVFFMTASEGGGDAMLRRVPLAGATATVLADLAANGLGPSIFVLDDTRAVWGGNGLHSVPKTGGAVTVTRSSVVLWDLVVADGDVYYFVQGQGSCDEIYRDAAEPANTGTIEYCEGMIAFDVAPPSVWMVKSTDLRVRARSTTPIVVPGPIPNTTVGAALPAVPTAVAHDGTSLYFMVNRLGTPDEPYAIVRVDQTNPNDLVVLATRVVANDQSELAIDGTGIYLGGNALIRIALDGSAKSLLMPVRCDEVEVKGGEIYFIVDGDVWRMPTSSPGVPLPFDPPPPPRPVPAVNGQDAAAARARPVSR